MSPQTHPIGQMNDSRHAIIAFFLGYLVLFVLIGLMLWPFIASIVFAAILTSVFYRPMEVLSLRTGHRKLSAILICLLILLALFLPFIFIIIRLSQEALDLYQHVRSQLTEEAVAEMLTSFKYLDEVLQDLFRIANLDYNIEAIQRLLLNAAASASSTVLSTLNIWIGDFFSFLLKFFIMIIVIYSLLVEGPGIKRFLLRLSPLPNDEEELVIRRFNQINYVTLIGNGIGGLIQGILAGIGFWFCGIESIALWTTVMVFLAFIPLVGITFVYIPVCIYLFVNDQVVSSLLLFCYCTLVAQLVENWFKPRFVGTRVQINSVLVFLSIIGGLAVFGVAGIFYGPLVIAIFLTFVDLYHKRYSNH